MAPDRKLKDSILVISCDKVRLLSTDLEMSCVFSTVKHA